MTTLVLPYPKLVKGRFASIEAYSDEALFEVTGVRIAFTCRKGGVSKGSYESLNLGTHVGDFKPDVLENRNRVREAFSTPEAPLLVPKQVHGDTVLTVDAQTDLLNFLLEIDKGADGLVIDVPRVAALLCYADCVPIILVSPSGCFAVVHAGWRGVMNTIAVKAALHMAQLDERKIGSKALGSYNVYFGPHIRRECFETSEELHDSFVDTFGKSCDAGYRHIDLAQALQTQLVQAGISPERICDLGLCTVCHTDEFFSYRAENGVTGRHGAFAVRST